MRFLIELEHRTTIPIVIDADSQEEALQALEDSQEGEPLTGDPIHHTATVGSVRVLGE